MASTATRIRAELDELVSLGETLKLSLYAEVETLDERVQAKVDGMNLPDFRSGYEGWYSKSLQVVKQLLPDRLEDFRRQYKDDKRKAIDHLTYGLSDYIGGVTITRYGSQDIDGRAALPNFVQQLNILESCRQRLDSALFDITEVLQADLFDDELDAARELLKKGFSRAAGALAGVVLEKHLHHVCETHALKSRKKSPGINDLNQLLKDSDVIDTPTWRFIQHLGDLRNLCDHPKDSDPSAEDVTALVDGVGRIIKTVF